MKHWLDCDCEGAVFVKHILTHLKVGDEVICKICNKTVAEIAMAHSNDCPACNRWRNEFDGANYCANCWKKLK